MAGGNEGTWAYKPEEWEDEVARRKQQAENEAKQKERDRQELLKKVEEQTSKIKSWSGVNWQAGLRNTAKITDIFIPGTHDSLTKNIKFNSGTALLDAIAGTLSVGIEGQYPFSTCQTYSIAEQLKAGIRFFDMRLDPEFNGRHGAVYTGEAFCTFDEKNMPNGGAYKTVIDFPKRFGNHHT